MMFTKYANYYVTLDEHAGDDEILDATLSKLPNRQNKSFKQRILRFLLCRCFRKDEIEENADRKI